jgi:hypothetical protein
MTTFLFLYYVNTCRGRLLCTQGKSPWYPLNRRLGGPQSQSERSGKDRNSQLLRGLETPIIQPVAQGYTTELSWLLNIRYMNTKKGSWAHLATYTMPKIFL